MIYFSEIKNKKVVTENGVCVGKLKDLLFLATGSATVTKLVVSDQQKNTLIIPIASLRNINSNIFLYGNYSTSELEINELYVEKNLLDKQIIDIKGSKIVRVNDVVMQNKPPLYIAGVDIGLLGLIRWLKLEKLFIKFHKLLGLQLTSKFLSWGDIQPLELGRGKVKLKKEEEKLLKVKPEDLADYLEKTTITNASKFINTLGDEFAAKIIANLNVNYQVGLFRNVPSEKAARILSIVSPDEAVDILLTYSVKKREQIINLLSESKKQEIVYLLQLSKTSIGKLVTSQFIAVFSDYTVREVLNTVRERTAGFSFLNYIYVVNKESQLVGVVNLHELILEDLTTPVYKFMIQNIDVIHLTTPEEIVIKKMAKYKIEALPVIDNNKHILGIVTFDDVADFLLEKI